MSELTGDDGIRVERRGCALVATIDRPGARNAICRQTAREIEAFALRASGDEAVRVAVVTGAGHEVFAAGGDLREFDQFRHEKIGADHVLEMGAMMAAIEGCAVPVIAAVQGMALGGGCELALACDLVVMEEQAVLSFRQAAMGLSTGWGGGTRLVERAGPMVAARVLLQGETVSAADALALGLVTEVVPTGGAMGRALEVAARVANLPRASVAGIKRMLCEVRRARRSDSLVREAEVFASLWGGPDHLRAMDSFFKRG